MAGTGMGKTLGFWLPLLFCLGGIQVVITPLNMLGKQNVASLAKVGIQGIAINSETATAASFSAIGSFQYDAIVISPEQMMKPNSNFEKLLKNPLFTSRIISIVIDEAHCLTQWGEFHPNNNLVIIHRSSDHPNIRIGVKKIQYTLSSYVDLAFLILNRTRLAQQITCEATYLQNYETKTCLINFGELTGKAVLFVEKDYFNDEKILKAARKVKNDLA
ncbi:hypothetical protein SCLCIDRAFT_9509 [Scleroderma citrinum Foug A]|uniref:DNA 3'-5' helicase n=1 Tax=Scleroderma citrinum Foug A TaxID=1036808 RepID=A0A0C3A8H1_9AGAM|nr:hypothetical protein SCLCIDRAFT_9509 [Scleroderma citrinum Foug A]